MKTKKFTILHSNDMHGDFLAEILMFLPIQHRVLTICRCGQVGVRIRCERTISPQQVLEEWLRNNQNVGRKVEGRLVYK